VLALLDDALLAEKDNSGTLPYGIHVQYILEILERFSGVVY
jgi:hypothetical protein